MNDVVLDASVVLKWFATKAEVSFKQAQKLRERHRAGELFVTVPSLLYLEILNVAGRRWAWPESDLIDLAASLKQLAFDVAEAELENLTPWIAGGLSAYDASYVALAESREIPLITDDERILALAGSSATPLSSIK